MVLILAIVADSRTIKLQTWLGSTKRCKRLFLRRIHSLNLVRKAAANSCTFAVHFFNFVQNIYTFFTATPERYAILVAKLSNEGGQFYAHKNLSDTRLSGRADAIKALINSYDKF